ncbi:MAG: TetR/AcrR family transcriptional regulator, partial [Polaromonas sp.]|nr:TetR/AcrR family transcriptional regulator [Polaromonas sp.]
MPAKATSPSTRDNILRAATRVFAHYGYDGGSLEKISKSAKSVDRMIYYYFGSKEGLFIEVLENAYRRMNDAELKLKLDTSQPLDGLNKVIAFVLSYYRKNPEFITLLNLENLKRGKHIAKSESAREYSSPAIAIISELLQNGIDQK